MSCLKDSLVSYNHVAFQNSAGAVFRALRRRPFCASLPDAISRFPPLCFPLAIVRHATTGALRWSDTIECRMPARPPKLYVFPRWIRWTIDPRGLRARRSTLSVGNYKVMGRSARIARGAAPSGVPKLSATSRRREYRFPRKFSVINESLRYPAPRCRAVINLISEQGQLGRPGTEYRGSHDLSPEARPRRERVAPEIAPKSAT